MTTDNATTPNQDEREALVQLIVDHEPRKGFQAHEIFNLADAILAANFHRNVGAVRTLAEVVSEAPKVVGYYEGSDYPVTAVPVAALNLSEPVASPSPSVVTTVEDVERVLGISLWNAESFRGDVRIDFNEYGQILEVELLPTSPPPSEVRVTGEALPEIAHKGSSTDAEMFERMAWNLDNDYPAGGSNARNALSRLIRREIRRAAGIPVAGEES